MNQTWENGQKPSFRTNFAPYGPNLGLRNFFPGFYLYMLDIVASYHCMQFQGKLKNQTWETGKKTLLLGLILAQIWATNFFFSKIWLCQSLEIMVSYHHVQYQKKLMIQSWENLVMDGQTDRQTKKRTDGQTDESDFIGCCLTNVERPKIVTSI